LAVPVALFALVLSVAPGGGAADDGAMRLVWERTVNLSGPGVPCSVVCDLDGDGTQDVLLSKSGKRGPWWTIALDGATGKELWRREHPARAVVRVARAPCGQATVVAASGRRLEMLDGSTGDAARSIELRGAVGGVALAGLDGDGAADVVCAVGDERDDGLLAFSGSDLSPLWSAEAEPDDGRFGEGFGRIICCDSDGDGRDEVFVTENTDALVRIDPDGSRRWSRRLGERTALFPKGAATSVPLVADLTGDGLSDVAIGCLAGGLVVLEADTGEVVAQLRFGVESHGDAALGRRVPRFLKRLLAESGEPVNDLVGTELDGYPGSEIVFGCSDGFVYAVSLRSGESLWRFDSEGQVHDAPIPLDLSGDGLSDIIAWDTERAYLLDGRDGTALPGLPDVSSPSQLCVSDLNGDSTLELIVVEREPATVAVWTTGVACDRVPNVRGSSGP
jgi:outer membrane protein assembly factor BamB